MADFTFEADLGARVAGIDEAGRGPWAGPVTAAAVVLDRTRLPDDLCLGLADSKTLPAVRRAHLAARLRACPAALIGLGLADEEEIERLNILGATMLAMRRAFEALPVAPQAAIIDGDRMPELPCPARTLVKGDAKSLSIAAASIIAKVARDSIMDGLALAHPGYGWERNRGYGTREHQDALARLGPTVHHRKGFAPVRRYFRKD